MKKVLFLATIVFFSISAATAQKKANINGDYKSRTPVEKVYLFYVANEERVKDSADLVKGKFQFSAQIDEPQLAMLMVTYKDAPDGKKKNPERMPLYIEPGNITVVAKDSLDNATVMGSATHAAYQHLNTALKPYNAKQEEMRKSYMEFSKAKNEEGMKKVGEDFDKLAEEINEKVYHKYLIDNPKSPIALYVLNQYVGYDMDAEKAEKIFNGLSQANQNSGAGIKFKERIATAKKTAVGSMAMDFIQNDTLGKPVSLSSFKGKYVLLDFWASWCGPCRAENPNVVTAFNNYKDEGFTVLGVSLDQPGKKQAWLDAIHKDGLTWTQLSDLKGWENEASQLYGVRAIPQNFLIDPFGKIIAKNIRGEELQTKLSAIFK